MAQSNKVEVDPEALTDKGRKLAELPAEPNGLFEILTELADTLSRLGQPWGEDKLGKQFSEGKDGYLASKDLLIGNASTGSDASGAVPIYGQLLVNYGRTLEEAGKVFGGGEDLFAEWILKHYIDENASGNPGQYTGPLSSGGGDGDGKKDQNPNDKKDTGGGSGGGDGGGSTGPTGPSNPSYGEGSGTDGGSKPTLPDTGSTGPGHDGSGSALGDYSGPPVTEYASPDPTGSTTFDPDGTSVSPGDPLLRSGIPTPGALGPQPYSPLADPTGGRGGSGPGGIKGTGGVGGNPLLRPVAFDGEKLANKSASGGGQNRAGLTSTGQMPGMPGGGMPATGNQSGPADRAKPRERRKVSPQVEEQPADGQDPGDPWLRSGWRTGER